MKTESVQRIVAGAALVFLATGPMSAIAAEPGGQAASPSTPKAPKAAKPLMGPDERAVMIRLKRLYPSTTFTSVGRTPVPGMFEVIMGPNIAYVSADARHFLFGHLFDMQRQVDLTAMRKPSGGSDELATYEKPQDSPDKAIKVADLPLKDAIKQVNGKGTRTLVVFSDPLCPYCKRLEAAYPELADTTIYTFLIPILGANSRDAALAHWARAVPERAEESAVLDRNLKLASRYGITSTPTLVRADGQSTAGALPTAELNTWLNASAAAPAKAEQVSAAPSAEAGTGESRKQ